MRKLFCVALMVLLLSTVIAQADEYYVKHKGDKRTVEPVEGMATIYIFRPASGGGAVRTWAFADDQLIGVMKGRAYCIAQVPEGTHMFWSKAENVSALDVDVKAGETYYFKQTIKMGVVKARVKMIEVSEEDSVKFFKKCSFCEPTEAATERAAEIIADRLDKATEKAEKRQDSD